MCLNGVVFHVCTHFCLCRDQKVLHKLLVAYGGFTILREIILQPEEHPCLDTALEALFAVWQAHKQLRASELGALHSAKDQHLQVAREIVQVATSIHAEENTLPAVLASPPCPPSAVSSLSHEAPGSNSSSSSDAPPCKKARVVYESDDSCCYRKTCESSPPDFTFAVTGPPSVGSEEPHAGDEDCTVAQFPAHRRIMGAASDVFATLLCGSFREASEDTVRLLDVEPSSFQVLLHHTYGCRETCKHLSAYSGEVSTGNSDRHLLSRVLALADRYMMVELINDTEGALSRYVSAEFVLELFSLATLHRADELQRCCVELIFDTSAQFTVEMGRKLLSEGLVQAALEVFQRMAGLQ